MLAASESDLMGWLSFGVLFLIGAGALPVAATLLRRLLPDSGRGPRFVAPLRLGASAKTRRSPRHAVTAHRTFLTGMTMTGISLVLLAFVGALRFLDLWGLLVAIGFVFPSLVVVLHSRRRDPRRRHSA